MTLPKRYNPKEAEPRLEAAWQAEGIYHYQPEDMRNVFSIDTPPPTVSGYLHLGHVYSYSHADFVARFQRMRGCNVYYPMGFDDNGLPTERLVEKRLGIHAQQVGRQAFIEKCLEVSEEAEQEYRQLWQRLGLSIDWRYTYRTIDARSRRTSQRSFIDLYRKGLAYRKEAPAIWCPECRTALAQADLNDMERESEFVELEFTLTSGPPSSQAEASIRIATTRPELLPACVAVFVHPEDARYHGLAGKTVRVPLFGQEVPVLEDRSADPQKGTGAVMCCTFGDATDVAWWRSHNLPLIEAIGPDGHMTAAAGEYAGLTTTAARRQIKEALQALGLLEGRTRTTQTIRVHERCDTPVEYIVAQQWFVRVLDFKAQLLEAGERVRWRPSHMLARYRDWVENLNWDWCITRQRYYGVPFPVWYCRECGRVMLAEEDELPVDPLAQQPGQPCECGSKDFLPDPDVMDTWATSSLSPQIAGRWLDENGKPGGDPLYAQVFPFSLRPQAHEIIRTWAFYTLAKSQFHFNALPWENVMISGWGIAGEGMGKISKSRGGGPMAPMEMIERYSADALRYWAASAGAGKDAVISEEKIQMGAKLATKLWNVAAFSARFLDGYRPEDRLRPNDVRLTPADRWIMAHLQRVTRLATHSFEAFDYSAAKNEVEAFFWRDLADNYLEMCKLRLYDSGHPQHEGARATLYQVLLTTLKLFAPLLPYVTDEIYRYLFSRGDTDSIHTSRWPQVDPDYTDPQAEALGEALVEIATAVRRYKSERSLPLGSELSCVQVALKRAHDAENSDTLPLAADFEAAIPDLLGITRAQRIEIIQAQPDGRAAIEASEDIRLYIEA